MHSIPRFLLSIGVLLLVAPAPALAESPMPEPIAPAVVGRPLYLVRPARVAPRPPAPPKAAAARPRTARALPARAALAAAPAAAAAAAPALVDPGTGRAPKQAVDDRADPRSRLPDVGQGTQVARKPLGTGAYIGQRHRSAVRKYYEQHPRVARRADWKVGEPVPRKARLVPVPRALLASLPKVPPGHRYAQLGGEVVLIAFGSNMVVDGISRDGG